MAIIHQQAVMRAESGVDLRECEGCFVKKDASRKAGAMHRKRHRPRASST